MIIGCNTTLHTGYAIQEVAHDNNQAVSKAILARGLINSYDTWHGMWFICNPLLLPIDCLLSMLPSQGTKGVAKAMKTVATGRIKDKGKTWFEELSDKRK